MGDKETTKSSLVQLRLNHLSILRPGKVLMRLRLLGLWAFWPLLEKHLQGFNPKALVVTCNWTIVHSTNPHSTVPRPPIIATLYLIFLLYFAQLDDLGEVGDDRADVVLQTFLVRLQQGVLGRWHCWLGHCHSDRLDTNLQIIPTALSNISRGNLKRWPKTF